MQFVLWLPRLLWNKLTALFGDAAWVFVGAFAVAPMGMLATWLLMHLIDQRPAAWSEETMTYGAAAILGIGGLVSIFLLPSLVKQLKGKKKSNYAQFDPDFDPMP